MTPRFDDDYGSYADSYATHYSAMSDASGSGSSYATHYGALADDVGTPPGSGPTGDGAAAAYNAFSDALGGYGASSTSAAGASSYDSYGSYAAGDRRFGSDLNVDMNSFKSSASALSPRESDHRDSDPLGHSTFFGATATAQQQSESQQQQFDLLGDSDVGTPRSPGSDDQPTPTQLRFHHDRADNHSVLSTGSQQNQHHHHHHGNVPLSPGSRASQQSKLSALSRGTQGGTFVSQKALSRESARELAKTALSVRATSIGDVTFEQPGETNLRESIRRVQVRPIRCTTRSVLESANTGVLCTLGVLAPRGSA